MQIYQENMQLHEDLLKHSKGNMEVTEDTILSRRVNKLKREIEFRDAKIVELEHQADLDGMSVITLR